jgi:hypothetical protein
MSSEGYPSNFESQKNLHDIVVNNADSRLLFKATKNSKAYRSIS